MFKHQHHCTKRHILAHVLQVEKLCSNSNSFVLITLDRTTHTIEMFSEASQEVEEEDEQHYGYIFFLVTKQQSIRRGVWYTYKVHHF